MFSLFLLEFANKFQKLRRRKSFSYHGDNRPRAKEVTQAIEERSFLEIMVMLLREIFGRNNDLDTNKLESLAFKSRNDL